MAASGAGGGSLHEDDPLQQLDLALGDDALPAAENVWGGFQAGGAGEGVRARGGRERDSATA